MYGRRLSLAQLEVRLLRVVDPAAVFFLEADAGDLLIRLASRQTLRDERPLGHLATLLEPLGFLRIHRSTLPNPDRVFEIRRRRRCRKAGRS